MKDACAKDCRLSLFLPDMGGGGAERVALAMIKGFLDRQFSVDLVLASASGSLLPLVPPEVEIYDLGTQRQRKALLPLVGYLRSRRPEALHAMMWPLPLMATMARTLARVDTRIVGSEHTPLSGVRGGLDNFILRAVTSAAYRSIDGLVAVSAGTADDMAELLDIPRGSIEVIHNPLILPDELPEGSPGLWPEGSIRLLAVGELKAEKNYPLLVDALAMVRQRIDASLLILGEGEQTESLKSYVAEKDLSRHVVFAGFDVDVWPYFRASDLFVLSSDFEGYGNVLIEAMHAGIPIVSTDCPTGPREILKGGEFGALVECGNARALADAIVSQLENEFDPEPGRRRAAQLSGEEPIEAHLSVMLGGLSERRA